MDAPKFEIIELEQRIAPDGIGGTPRCRRSTTLCGSLPVSHAGHMSAVDALMPDHSRQIPPMRGVGTCVLLQRAASLELIRH